MNDNYILLYHLDEATFNVKSKVQKIINSCIEKLKPRYKETMSRLIEDGCYNYFEDEEDSVFISIYESLHKVKDDLLNANYTANYSKHTKEVISYLRTNGIKIAYSAFNGPTWKFWKKLKEDKEKGKLKTLMHYIKSKKIASFSGGKDSAWMIIECINRGIEFDKIVFFDTTLEFPEMYDYIDKFEKYIKQKIIRLKTSYTFDELFFKEFSKGKNQGRIRGFPYVIGQGCWAKRDMKLKQMNEFKKSLNDKYIDYIGIAYDEPERYQRLNIGEQFAPLYEWKIKEAECLQGLKDLGLHNELYDKFKRLGCWLCPKQSNASLYNLYKYYPELWEKLKWYESQDSKTFKPDLSLLEIEKKFINKDRSLF